MRLVRRTSPGMRRRRALKSLRISSPRAVPVHGLEYSVINMLDGDIQIFYDLGVLRDLVNELVVKLIGIGVVQSYPFNSVYPAYPAAQLGKTSLTVKIRSVTRYVLCDDDDLLDAVRSEVTRLLNDVFNFS